MSNFAKRVIAWHHEHGRHDLPWQQDKSAYRVFISEIMLQQTQVTTVIPYFLKFMLKFPTIYDLAQAKLDDVLALWSGLGYYARARHLWRAAQIIVQQFSGEFPQDLLLLQTLPGVGRSTAAAILSLAFDRSATILDGNVRRVLARFCAIDLSPKSPQFQQQLWEIAQGFTPKKNNAIYTQAMMDLGAAICTRSQPKCEACPVKKNCKAYAEKNPTRYPLMVRKDALLTEDTYFLAIENKSDQRLFIKRSARGIWGALWCLPQFNDLSSLQTYVKKNKGRCQKNPNIILHTFTHKRWKMHIYRVCVSLHACAEITENLMQSAWVNDEDALQLALPAPLRQWLLQLRSIPA